MEIRIVRFGRAVTFLIDDPEDHIQKQIVNSKSFYEPDLLDAVFHRIMPGMRFVDVGANIGNHSLFFAGIAGMSGWALEPYQPSFERLRANLDRNGLTDCVTVLNQAAGRSSARGICRLDENGNAGLCRVEPDPLGEIEIIAIDDQKFGAFHLLKIDVEGFELEVLEGAAQSLASHRPLVLVEAQTPDRFEAIAAFMLGAGYRPTRRYCVTATYLFEPSD